MLIHREQRAIGQLISAGLFSAAAG